ncbi:hypothetical protein ABIC28_001611 [Rhodococcus sp. PvR044]|uniref:hypothetical protein n=1 Tax=Rhodococcus sp. PvR044 TaxID=3156402 RepID=UPI0033915184
MDQDEPSFTTLGVTGAMPPLPDDVWERALTIALDPTTPAVDTDLVPDMDDIPLVPEDDEIVLSDDVDGPLLDNDRDGADVEDAPDDSIHHSTEDLDLSVDLGGIDDDPDTSGTVDLTVDEGDFEAGGDLDFGGDLY